MSQASMAMRLRPLPSLPITSTTLPESGASQMTSLACSLAPTTQKPSSFRAARLRARLDSIAMGRWSTAPALVL